MEHEPKETFEEARDRIRARCQELLARAQKRLDAWEIGERLKKKADELETRYPENPEYPNDSNDAKNHIWYHAMFGSGVSSNESRIRNPEDFPGEDSVEKFLESLASDHA